MIFGVMTLPAVAQTDSVSKNVQLKEVVVAGDMAVSYTHLRAHRDTERSRMPSSA